MATYKCISALVLTCFRLTKGRATLFDPKQLLWVSCILWCYFTKWFSTILLNASLLCSIFVDFSFSNHGCYLQKWNVRFIFSCVYSLIELMKIHLMLNFIEWKLGRGILKNFHALFIFWFSKNMIVILFFNFISWNQTWQ